MRNRFNPENHPPEHLAELLIRELGRAVTAARAGDWPKYRRIMVWAQDMCRIESQEPPDPDDLSIPTPESGSRASP